MPIRIAEEKDMPSVVAIYNQAIATRVSVGDLTPVSLESRREWMPLVAEIDGTECGHLYMGLRL